jgi:hypothetical protein
MKQNISKKNLDFCCFVTSPYDFLFFKIDVNLLIVFKPTHNTAFLGFVCIYFRFFVHRPFGTLYPHFKVVIISVVGIFSLSIIVSIF